MLGSVQRLRAIAVDNGALKTSPQMKVSVKQDQGQDIVEVGARESESDLRAAVRSSTSVQHHDDNDQPGRINDYDDDNERPRASHEYKHDCRGAAAGSTKESGVSTELAVLIGLLSFGAGIAVGAAINNNNYYYPRWGYGGVYYGRYPYYPPPYRPYYGGGWGPSRLRLQSPGALREQQHLHQQQSLQQ